MVLVFLKRTGPHEATPIQGIDGPVFLAAPDPRTVEIVRWALFVSYAATIVLAVRYLFVVPIVFSLLITLLLGLHGVRVARATRRLPRAGATSSNSPSVRP